MTRSPIELSWTAKKTSFDNQIQSILYDGPVVYPEFNVKVTNLSVGPDQCRNFSPEFAIFPHITQICDIFQLWGACTADTEEAVIMSRAPEVARATTPSLNERIALLCFSVIWLLII